VLNNSVKIHWSRGKEDIYLYHARGIIYLIRHVVKLTDIIASDGLLDIWDKWHCFEKAVKKKCMHACYKYIPLLKALLYLPIIITVLI